MKTLTVFFVFLFNFSLANAFTWVGPTKVSYFYLYSTGTAYFKTSTTHVNPDNCGNSNYLALDTTAPNFKYLYANLLLAYSQGLNVSINYNGCLASYPLIISIAIPSVW